MFVFIALAAIGLYVASLVFFVSIVSLGRRSEISYQTRLNRMLRVDDPERISARASVL
jgi:hypothetical protein